MRNDEVAGGYGLAWLDNRAGGGDHVYFARLDANGVLIGVPVPITAETDTTGADAPPALAWSPGRREYVVAWADQRHASDPCTSGTCGTEIYFARIDAAGRVIDPGVRVTTAVGRSSYPTLADDDTGFGLAWSDERDRLVTDENAEIYFTLLRCR